MLLDWIDESKLNWTNLSGNTHDGAIAMLFNAMKENPDKIDWFQLSKNSNDRAIQFLKENQNRIDWEGLCHNTNNGAIQLLKTKPDKIYWHWLTTNSSDAALNLLEENPDKIYWDFLGSNKNDIAFRIWRNYNMFNREHYYYSYWNYLSLNTNDQAIQLLKENPEQINWRHLSQNCNDNAIELLRENPERIYWEQLSINTNDGAIQLLKKNPEKMHWGQLSLNTNKYAVELLLNKIQIKKNETIFQIIYNFIFKPNEPVFFWNGETIFKNIFKTIIYIKKRQYCCWENLSRNTNKKVIEFLKENQDQIFWPSFSKNPSIFQNNQKLHREQFEVYKEDLYKAMYHPRFYVKFASAQDDELNGL